MRAELIGAYDNASRLDNPPLMPAELRAPDGAYFVGCEGDEAVAGGVAASRRRRGGNQADVRSTRLPFARRGGGAPADARGGRPGVGLPVHPPRHRPQAGDRPALYRGAGYLEIAPYNDNPFACFWGEKQLV